MQVIPTDVIPSAESVPTVTDKPEGDITTPALNFEQWIARWPALIRKMANDPGYRAEVDARCF